MQPFVDGIDNAFDRTEGGNAIICASHHQLGFVCASWQAEHCEMFVALQHMICQETCKTMKAASEGDTALPFMGSASMHSAWHQRCRISLMHACEAVLESQFLGQLAARACLSSQLAQALHSGLIASTMRDASAVDAMQPPGSCYCRNTISNPYQI